MVKAVELPYKFDNKRKTEINSRHVSPTSTDSLSQKGTSETEVKIYRQNQFSPTDQFYVFQATPTSVLPHQHRTVESIKTRNTCYPPSSSPPSLTSHNSSDTPAGYRKPDFHSSSKFQKPRSLTCRHCRKSYTQEENVKGSCEHAPDCMRSSIDTVTCVPCARSMIYHCMSDSEGNFAQQPCGCDTSDNGCAKRWLGLAILSILLPCLWCYPPLKVCHLCGVSCGACGGRHEPMNSPSTASS